MPPSLRPHWLQPGQSCEEEDNEYAGYNGALQCMLDGGDVAFVKHTTIDDYITAKGSLPDDLTKVGAQWAGGKQAGPEVGWVLR